MKILKALTALGLFTIVGCAGEGESSNALTACGRHLSATLTPTTASCGPVSDYRPVSVRWVLGMDSNNDLNVFENDSVFGRKTPNYEITLAGNTCTARYSFVEDDKGPPSLTEVTATNRQMTGVHTQQFRNTNNDLCQVTYSVSGTWLP